MSGHAAPARAVSSFPRAAVFSRHPRQPTNSERIRHYLLPLLPEGGDVPLDELRRADLREAQDALLRRRLAKSTIDGEFSALSALLRDAVDIELIDANPAARLRVRPADPRLDPERGPVQRRAVPPVEIRAFIAHVDARYRGACWAPMLTGCRPAELFAMHADEIDAPAQADEVVGDARLGGAERRDESPTECSRSRSSARMRTRVGSPSARKYFATRSARIGCSGTANGAASSSVIFEFDDMVIANTTTASRPIGSSRQVPAVERVACLQSGAGC